MSISEANKLPDVNTAKQKSLHYERAKELDNSHDANYNDDPQKWLILQCTMLWHIQHSVINYEIKLWSTVRIAHHISSPSRV